MIVNDLITARPALEKIAAKEMESLVARKFAEFTIEILKELQEFDAKRANYFEKYGEIQGEGEARKAVILKDNEKKFNAAIKRSLNKEVDIEPFDIASLDVPVAPADLINILPLFK